jgi:hypothetical protein
LGAYICGSQEPGGAQLIGFNAPFGGRNSMRGGHDPRQLDLIATFALLILIVAAFEIFNNRSPTPTTTAFIVPSQSVRW